MCIVIVCSILGRSGRKKETEQAYVVKVKDLPSVAAKMPKF